MMGREGTASTDRAISGLGRLSFMLTASVLPEILCFQFEEEKRGRVRGIRRIGIISIAGLMRCRRGTRFCRWTRDKGRIQHRTKSAQGRWDGPESTHLWIWMFMTSTSLLLSLDAK